eukprot:3894240-Prymnesium_polylepis.1
MPRDATGDGITVLEQRLHARTDLTLELRHDRFATGRLGERVDALPGREGEALLVVARQQLEELLIELWTSHPGPQLLAELLAALERLGSAYRIECLGVADRRDRELLRIAHGRAPLRLRRRRHRLIRRGRGGCRVFTLERLDAPLERLHAGLEACIGGDGLGGLRHAKPLERESNRAVADRVFRLRRERLIQCGGDGGLELFPVALQVRRPHGWDWRVRRGEAAFRVHTCGTRL